MHTNEEKLIRFKMGVSRSCKMGKGPSNLTRGSRGKTNLPSLIPNTLTELQFNDSNHKKYSSGACVS